MGIFGKSSHPHHTDCMYVRRLRTATTCFHVHMLLRKPMCITYLSMIDRVQSLHWVSLADRSSYYFEDRTAFAVDTSVSAAGEVGHDR